jgi:hypothetical protein
MTMGNSMTTKRDLNMANVRAAVLELGYDPDKADWPATSGDAWTLPGPTFELVQAVTRHLGWNPRHSEPRWRVQNHLKDLMSAARRRKQEGR